MSAWPNTLFFMSRIAHWLFTNSVPARALTRWAWSAHGRQVRQAMEMRG